MVAGSRHSGGQGHIMNANSVTTSDHDGAPSPRPPWRPLGPAYRVVALLVGILGLLGTFIGAAFVGSMAAHPETWLYTGLAVIAVVSLTLALLAFRYEAEAAVVRTENSELQRQLRQLKREIDEARVREQLDRIETTLENLKTPQAPWWKWRSR